MKNPFLRILLPTILLGLAACTKKEEKTELQYRQENDSGTLTVKLNGSDWNNQVVHAYYWNDGSSNKFTIAVDIYEGNARTGVLALESVDPNNPNNIVAKRNDQGGPYSDSAQASFRKEGAVEMLERFDVKAPGSFIVIDSYEGGNVKGHFELTMVRTDGDPARSQFPDTLKFTEGKFELKISNL